MQKQPTAVLLDTRPAWVFYSDILKGVWKAKKEATAIKKDEKGVVEECVTAVTRCFSCGEEKRRRKFWNNFFPRRPKSKGFWSFSRFWCGTMFLVHKSWYPREIVIKEKTKTNQNETKRKNFLLTDRPNNFRHDVHSEMVSCSDPLCLRIRYFLLLLSIFWAHQCNWYDTSAYFSTLCATLRL